MSAAALRVRTAVRCLVGITVCLLPLAAALLIQIIAGPDPAMFNH